MEAEGQVDRAQLTAADFSSKSGPSGAAKEPPAQVLLVVILLVIGTVAFSPMFLPMLTKHPHESSGVAPQPLDRSGKGRDMLYMQAHEMIHRGKYGPAIEELTRVINASPRRIDAYYNRGRCYMSMQEPQYDQALSDFNRAIALDPHDGDLYRLRAAAYEHLGNHAMALADRKMADTYTWHDPK